jgi:simple sugar transport system permease protein
MLSDGFTSSRGITDTLGLSTVLICTGISAAFAFQMNLYNIGGEGQLYLGMIGGAWAGLALGDRLPSYLMVPAVLFVGALAGALWILLPAFVRSRMGTSEIVTTLLLTYIAASLVKHFVYSPGSFFVTKNSAFPQGRLVPDSASLTGIDGTSLYPTFFLVILIALALFWIVKRTEYGYRIQVISDSPRAAHYAGINANRTTMSVMLISGALSGLGGAVLLLRLATDGAARSTARAQGGPPSGPQKPWPRPLMRTDEGTGSAPAGLPGPRSLGKNAAASAWYQSLTKATGSAG